MSRIHILNSVPTADLPAIFRQASVFCYPSFYEGFGIPIIEALSSGIPVIAATGSCLEEAGGADSIYVNPTDDKELAAAVMKILENPEMHEKMAQSGKEYVKRFEPKALSAEIHKIYESL
jgi:glycosyltransferase involved in cell wall biosynthesis